jgi:hypothetical protein
MTLIIAENENRSINYAKLNSSLVYLVYLVCSVDLVCRVYDV